MQPVFLLSLLATLLITLSLSFAVSADLQVNIDGTNYTGSNVSIVEYTPSGPIPSTCLGAFKTLPTSSKAYNFTRGGAYSFSFSSAVVGQGIKVSFNETSPLGTGYTPKLLYISDCEGTTTTYAPRCYAYGNSGVVYLNVGGVTDDTYCGIEANKEYFAVIADSMVPPNLLTPACPQGVTCGFTITTNRW